MFKQMLRLFLLGSGLLSLTGCTALLESATQALLRIQSTYVYIMDLVISIAYLSGAMFVVKGIFAFKLYGEQRTMYAPQITIRTPMAYFVAGIGLLFLPTMISITSNSIFMQPNISIIGYQGDVDSWDNVKAAVEGLVQVIGLISVVRAFFIASIPQPIGGGGGQGGISKAAIHFFAGLAALNIDYMIKLIDYYI